MRVYLVVDSNDTEWPIHVRWLLAHAPIDALRVIEDSPTRAARLLRPYELGPLFGLAKQEHRESALNVLANW